MRLKSLIIAGLVILKFSTFASAEELPTTNAEDLAAATGHYARARSLLVEAVREFDRGYKIADPNALIDGQRWRTTLIDRAQEIEKVLDPQPRVSKSGVKFNGDKRLLNEAKDE
jgi:hypothetical protein